MRQDTNVKPTMYVADVASIAAGATYSTPSPAISVAGLDFATIFLKATGHAAGSAGNISFYIVSSGDGINFSTAGTVFTLTLNTNVAVISEPYVLDLRGVNALKVLKIVNGDGAQQVDNLNVLLTCVKQ